MFGTENWKRVSQLPEEVEECNVDGDRHEPCHTATGHCGKKKNHDDLYLLYLTKKIDDLYLMNAL